MNVSGLKVWISGVHMRSLFALAVPLLLVACEKTPSTPAELAATRERKEATEKADKVGKLEGRPVYILEKKPTKPGARTVRSIPFVEELFHSRRDCPEVSAYNTNYDIRELKVKSGELVDDKGFFYRDKSPCEKCVP